MGFLSSFFKGKPKPEPAQLPVPELSFGPIPGAADIFCAKLARWPKEQSDAATALILSVMSGDDSLLKFSLGTNATRDSAIQLLTEDQILTIERHIKRQVR